MQQPVGEARRGLECMAERMAEIEQHAFAGLALVAPHDSRLGATTDRDSVLARRAAGEQVAPVGLQPGEEGGVVDQAVLGDFRIAGAKLARRERVEQRRVGHHQHRLVKRADQILAVRRVDPGLAADRGVDLGQQRGRDLHDVEPAPGDRRGEAGEVADHATTERHDEIAALDSGSQDGIAHGLEHAPALGRFARGKHQARGADLRRRKRRLGAIDVVPCNRLVGDDDRRHAGTQSRDARACGCQQAAPDRDVVGALAELDPHDGRIRGAKGGRHDMVSW